MPTVGHGELPAAVEIFSDRTLKISTAAGGQPCRTTAMNKTLLCLLASLSMSLPAMASDHLDTAAVIADPAGDIGDLYAWLSPDGKHLELVMTIVGKKFS